MQNEREHVSSLIVRAEQERRAATGFPHGRHHYLHAIVRQERVVRDNELRENRGKALLKKT